jgi:hypothetical protein
LPSDKRKKPPLDCPRDGSLRVAQLKTVTDYGLIGLIAR